MSKRPLRAHTSAFHDLQTVVRAAQLKERDPAAYDRLMEEQQGGRERGFASRRSFLRGSAAMTAGALGLGMFAGLTRRASAAPGTQVFNVAIVGAGIAGLNCAWQLRKYRAALEEKGMRVNFTLYEARPNRTGGRMLTSTGDVATNMKCELGAEFIDSSNDDMFALVQDEELNEVCRRDYGHPLAMIDTGQDLKHNQLIQQHLFVKGAHHTFEEAVEKMRGLVRGAQEDVARIALKCERFMQASKAETSCGGTGAIGFNDAGMPSGALNDGELVRLDNMSVDQFIRKLKIAEGDEWVRAYFDVAYRTEYGTTLEHQSALSLISLFGAQGDEEEIAQQMREGHKDRVGGEKPQEDQEIDIFGSSDERFKILGGNDMVLRCLTKALAEHIKLGHRLEAVEKASDSSARYTLVFDASSVARGTQVVSDVDLIVFATPFTMLSTVRLSEGLQAPDKYPRFARMRSDLEGFQPDFFPPADLSGLGINQRKADVINQIGYGRNMKVMAGLDRAVWRDQKQGRFGGYTFSDELFQMGWDSGQCQDLKKIPTARQSEQSGRYKDMSRSIFSKELAGRLPERVIAETSYQDVDNPFPATGRQFSWFLGGGLATEGADGILNDRALRSFVTHSRGVPGEGATPGQTDAITAHINRIVESTDKVYAGFLESFCRQGRVLQRHASSSYAWVNDPFTRGSYLAYRPGQWTRMSGLEGAPLTFKGSQANFSDCKDWTIFFAGEHCSAEFQGFMNGGAQTGRLAAQRILMRLVGSAHAAVLISPTELTRLYTRRRFVSAG